MSVTKNVSKIIYVSCVLPEEKEKKLVKIKPRSASIQAYKYHRLLAEGFAENDIDISIISYQRYLTEIGVRNEDTEVVNNVNYHYLIPNGKKKTMYADLFRKVYRKTCEMIQKEKDVVVICDILNLTISYAACLAAKRMHIPTIGIVTDFPSMNGAGLFDRLRWRLIDKCDKWVLLTEQMYDYLNRKKPAVILEGHIDNKMICRENKLDLKESPRRCIYAGGLKRIHGIEKLVKAFQMANIDNAELHVYGSGEYENELKNLHDDRIVYHGIVANEEVVDAELKAALLLNPRPSSEEFTKYSFPSKNMEYMASGTPLLTTQLPGMPKEYLDYVYIFHDESIEGMSNTLCGILAKSDNELFEKGKEAKNFVIKNKTNVVQARKIISLINGVC